MGEGVIAVCGETPITEREGMTMGKIEHMCAKYDVKQEDLLEVILGGQNSLLPGGLWTAYWAEIREGSVRFVNDVLGTDITVPYTAFRNAEFRIGNGNLWMQCMVYDDELVFCSPRRSWRSSAAQRFIAALENHLTVFGKKDYDRMMGKLFWLYMFK